MKKRKKKLPWSKHKSIDKRFLDLRFNGLEDAINLMGIKIRNNTSMVARVLESEKTNQ